MTESTPDVQTNAAAGPEIVLPSPSVEEDQEPAADGPTDTPEAPAVDSGHVPDKQIHRWKDDGGAVMFDH